MSEMTATGAHDPAEIKSHIKGYIIVGALLYVGTIVTVLVATLQLPTPAAILVAIAIAATKATLVALYFMHLINEKKLIYWTLLLTALMFILCMLLPSFTVKESLGVKMHQEIAEKHLHGTEAPEGLTKPKGE